MGCGDKAKPCGKPIEDLVPRRSDGHGVRVSLSVLKIDRARKAMCITCPFRRSCALGVESSETTKARQDPGQTCWAGRWPDQAGIVRIGLLARQGVPKGIRLRLGLRAAWRSFKRHWGANGEYPGCGCVVAFLGIRDRLVLTSAKAAAWAGQFRKVCAWRRSPR
jgi:hypothetical protein